MKKRLALLLIIPVLLAAGVLLYVALSGTYITQYADQTGSQAMFYTIETGKGHLIVVDGGTSGNRIISVLLTNCGRNIRTGSKRYTLRR